MGLEYRFRHGGYVHLVCDTCGRGRAEGTGLSGDPYRYPDAPDKLIRVRLLDNDLWVCEECYWELTRKELKCD